MTSPSDKANELIDKFIEHAYPPESSFNDDDEYRKCELRIAKQCALICADEILSNDSMGISYDHNQLVCDTDYWQQVKEEISKP